MTVMTAMYVRSTLLTATGLLCNLFVVLAAVESEPLKWQPVSNDSALCNDFTKAGFFHRNATEDGAGKWVVFLESGSLCFSNETCNRRYFQSHIRDKFSRDKLANGGFGDFDTNAAYDAVKTNDGAELVNPLMTSMSCFNDSKYFPNGRLEIEGKDFFDRTTNPHVLQDHGQVVVPYCSSDIWLGSQVSGNRTCECFDSECFAYNPNSSGLQFTFRGKIIFQSVLKDLDSMYGLDNARELVLIGSSAGGLGVLNLARWVTDEYPHLSIKVITDSSWFINFRDGINQQFSALQESFVSPEISTGDSVATATPSPTSAAGSQGSLHSSLSPVVTPGDVMTSSTAMPDASSAGSRYETTVMSGHVVTPSIDAAPTSHVITSSPMPNEVLKSTVFTSTHETFSSLVAPTTTQLNPSENFATPTPSIELASGGSGLGSGEIFSGSGESFTGSGVSFGSHEDIKRYASENRQRRNSETRPDEDLLSLLKSHEACYDTRRGYPCCLSAQCVLTESSPTTNEPYFPRGIRLFVLTSIYDAFILSSALKNLQPYISDSSSNPVGLAVEYLTLLGEYGGAMDNSLTGVQDVDEMDLSVYASQCFQHIYFATSTLWGEGRIFGTDPVVIRPDVGTFRHSIRSGVWNTSQLAYMNGDGYTIMEAINVWYQNETDTSMIFRDICRTPHCNYDCPETFTFDPIDPKEWPFTARIGIAAGVISIAVISILLKACFCIWLRFLERKQTLYLRSISRQENDEPITSISLEEGLKRKFPYCNPDQAISVACLDLHYSVTTRVGKQLKDEKRENFAPVALDDLSPEDELSGSDSHEEQINDLPRDRNSKRMSGAFQRLKNALTPTSTETYRIPTFRPENENIDKSLYRMKNGSTQHRKSSASHHGRVSRQSNFSQETYDELPEESRASDCCSGIARKMFRTKRKKILKGISVYFNPGEMIGIMGPSGCGKTTFLDILTGRRKSGNFSGEIFINGVPIEENRNWYISNTGYVIQLARPYYEELTVRENLTLAAWMRLPDTAREKFQRVEQVMDVSGLLDLADTVVGGATTGLSGGQKRRLAVALQLLKLPSVIFLDEPTSGLDAASSRELLAHLNELAASNRTVVLTIHQPRLEIFHMFDRLVLLSDGKVAYHGVPDKAYEVFVNALRSRYLQQRLIIPDLEDRNPADVIMDMLGNQRMRQLITDYYQCTDEPNLVSHAVMTARSRERKFSEDVLDGEVKGRDINPSTWGKLKVILKGYRRVENTQNHLLDRIATLEARASKRATPFVVVYLPLVFFAYGILLGTVYLQQDQPFLIMSGFCVYSVASALFMFPALYSYYQKALEIYTFEHADGAGRAYDLVIQPFIRFITMAIIPVVACALILYVLLVDYTRWSWEVFGQLVIVNVALNQAWVGLLIWLILTFPKLAFRLSPPLASIMGFTSGFFIPFTDIPWWYRWLTYINPNFYGFSASAFLLLNDFETECEKTNERTELECYPQSGAYILNTFDFNDINPYYNITVLFGMTIFFLLVAVLSNWWNHFTLQRGMKKVRLMAKRLRRAASIDTSSLFSTSLGDYESVYSEDESVAGELNEREDILSSTEPGEGAIPLHNTLSPISEEYASVEREVGAESAEPMQAESKFNGNYMWEHPARYPHRQGSSTLPTSMPEEARDVNLNRSESATPQPKIRERWKKAFEYSQGQKSNDFEMKQASEPSTPHEKHVAFEDGFKRRPSRINSYEGGRDHRIHRKKTGRSVYLRDGEIHSVWKPRSNSQTTPTAPSPPPTHLADVVHEVMRQKKLDLRERQRQLASRVTATQAVLKEQNEELAAVAELTEEEEEEKEKDEDVLSGGETRDTPSKKMWQHVIKTVMEENKDDKKKKRRNRKRSTVHFHEVVTNKVATMDHKGAQGYPSVSEHSGGSPQKVRRNTSLSRKRQDTTTPTGAIPFSQWKSQYFEKQRATRQEAMKQFRSDYRLKPPSFSQSQLPRMNSDNNLMFPANRRSSTPTLEDMEPRSKSVGLCHPSMEEARRRSSTPDCHDYEDHGEMSDTSVAIDILSPLSSRSASPSVFSDEERRSKMQSRTPVTSDVGASKVESHQPLMKLDSEEVQMLSHPSNMKKRVQKRTRYRQMHQDSHSADDVIEVSTRPAYPPVPYGAHGQKRRRPTDVSISLPTSPCATPSPQPTTPQTQSRGVSPSYPNRKQQCERIIPSPEVLNDRISKEQTRRESLQHLSNLTELDEEYHHHNQHQPLGLRRSSTPNILDPRNSGTPLAPSGRRISTPTPPLQTGYRSTRL